MLPKLKKIYTKKCRFITFLALKSKVISDLGRVSIAVITVLLNRSNFEEYRLAQETFECYALYHGYKWIVVDLSADRTFEKFCPQNDVSSELEEENEAEILFLWAFI